MIVYYIISGKLLRVDDRFIFDKDIIESGMIKVKISNKQIESINRGDSLCWIIEDVYNDSNKIIDNLIKGKYI